MVINVWLNTLLSRIRNFRSGDLKSKNLCCHTIEIFNSLPQLNLPEGGQPRMWHTATALSLWPGRTQVITFGGTPRWERGKSDAAQQKLAKTAVAEFGELHTYMVLIFLSVLYS